MPAKRAHLRLDVSPCVSFAVLHTVLMVHVIFLEFPCAGWNCVCVYVCMCCRGYSD